MILAPEKDQHLLKDSTEIISAAELRKKDRVIEIGAGTGIITKELARKACKVLAFEIDPQFKENLEPLEKRYPNLNIVYGNALDYDWRGYNKIVSNIPFSLLEPTLLKAISEETKTLVLIVSKSFMKNLLSDSKIGLVARLFFSIESIIQLKKEGFIPEPKTECWIMKLKRKESKSRIDLILREIVLSERKIKNAIIYALVKTGKTKNQAREMLKQMNIAENALSKPAKKATAKFLLILRENLKQSI